MAAAAPLEAPPAPPPQGQQQPGGHLVVFVHGLTASCSSSDLRHGRALAERLEGARCADGAPVHLLVSAASAGWCGAATFAWTLAGVRQAGARLAAEVRAELARTQATRLSFVGASLGGLFARRAAALLFEGGGEGPRPAGVLFATLATPHLGVRGLLQQGALARFAGRLLTRTLPELLWEDSGGPYLGQAAAPGAPEHRALLRFSRRVAYAPLRDDGVVPYPTAAMCPAAPSPAAAPAAAPAVVAAEGSTSAELSAAELERAFWAADREAGPQIEAAMRALRGMGWEVVDVDLPHKELATLYPSRHGSSEVADHLCRCLGVTPAR
eukprot:TRINITY_DN9871_c0_g1_i1.p1 TRINITY_DN9871_c0_g1~~TRINITY_DN9871_c0_g1_i1.p1  ORF type:complete len:352 (+),score=110.08 TRINITY_DN9871_c0_g1_i1:81-1058(+)